MIRRVQPDARGEIQLTNAIQWMCDEGKRVLAVKLPPGERRYDIGNFPSYFERSSSSRWRPDVRPGPPAALERILRNPR